jgi:ribose-phosphate pyrophosphokinase
LFYRFDNKSLGKQVNENLMELLLTITALKRNGAERIHIILPYIAYMRMDRPVKDYKAITGADVIQLMCLAGANSIYGFDVHCEQLLGAAPFNVHSKNLDTCSLTEEAVNELPLENLTIVSPDLGALKRCKTFIDYHKQLKKIELPLAVVDKTRKLANQVDSVQVLIGDIQGRDCFLIDDMIDTGVRL